MIRQHWGLVGDSPTEICIILFNSLLAEMNEVVYFCVVELNFIHIQY